MILQNKISSPGAVSQLFRGLKGRVSNGSPSFFARLFRVVPKLNRDMRSELCEYLDSLEINGDNIGSIRRRLMMPWDCEWNSIVRDETAKRERLSDYAFTKKGVAGPNDASLPEVQGTVGDRESGLGLTSVTANASGDIRREKNPASLPTAPGVRTCVHNIPLMEYCRECGG